MTFAVPSYTVAVGISGTVVVTENAGTSWTTFSTGLSTTLRCAAGGITSSTPGGDACIVVGDSGSIAVCNGSGGGPAYPNFSTWTSMSSGTLANLYGVAVKLAGAIVAVGAGGACVTSSGGGTSWTVQTTGTSEDLNSVIYDTNNSLFVAVGNGGTILTSPDGVTWTARTSGTVEDLLSVNSLSISFVSTVFAVGRNGTILSSTNDTTWTAV
jgi:photosystem II stability/assembly factor-like uncharacterized protein